MSYDFSRGSDAACRLSIGQGRNGRMLGSNGHLVGWSDGFHGFSHGANCYGGFLWW